MGKGRSNHGRPQPAPPPQPQPEPQPEQEHRPLYEPGPGEPLSEASRAWIARQRALIATSRETGVKQYAVAPEAYRTLAPIEREIERYSRATPFLERRERAVIVRPNGEISNDKWGSAHRVVWRGWELTPAWHRLRDGVLTHNHPNSTSFSRADWRFAAHSDLAAIRAFGDDNAHELQRPDGGWPSEARIGSAFRSAQHAVRSDFQARLAAGEIDGAAVSRDYSHALNLAVAERLGVPYQRVWRRAAEARPGEAIVGPPPAARASTRGPRASRQRAT